MERIHLGTVSSASRAWCTRASDGFDRLIQLLGATRPRQAPAADALKEANEAVAAAEANATVVSAEADAAEADTVPPTRFQFTDTGGDLISLNRSGDTQEWHGDVTVIVSGHGLVGKLHEFDLGSGRYCAGGGHGYVPPADRPALQFFLDGPEPGWTRAWASDPEAIALERRNLATQAQAQATAEYGRITRLASSSRYYGELVRLGRFTTSTFTSRASLLHSGIELHEGGRILCKISGWPDSNNVFLEGRVNDQPAWVQFRVHATGEISAAVTLCQCCCDSFSLLP